MIGRTDGWMMGHMDKMMLHVTTSFNICNVGDLILQIVNKSTMYTLINVHPKFV